MEKTIYWFLASKYYSQNCHNDNGYNEFMFITNKSFLNFGTQL